MTSGSERLLWGTTLALLATAVGVAMRPRPRARTAFVVAALPALPAPARHDAARRADAAEIVGNDPFRLSREPAPTPFEPGKANAALPPAAPSAPRASFILRGVVGGPPWEALVEGFPARPGPLLVRQGERIGDLYVRLIKRDTVVIGATDTTWRLGVSRGWP